MFQNVSTKYYICLNKFGIVIDRQQDMVGSNGLYALWDGTSIQHVLQSDYIALRNKIKRKLSQFYTEVTFNDAGFTDDNIVYFCHKYSRLIIKSFKAVEWIEAEKNNRFEQKYSEFIKSKKSTSISSLVGKDKSYFRKKRLA